MSATALRAVISEPSSPLTSAGSIPTRHWRLRERGHSRVHPLGDTAENELATFSPVETARARRLGNFMAEGYGYFQIQATRPQTLSYRLTDPPVGQLDWIVEKFKEWTSPAYQLPEEAVPRDEIFADVSLYWYTPAAGSSASNVYYETMHSGDRPSRSEAPTGVTVFAESVAIRRYAEQANNIVHWSDVDTGGQFAALEVPDHLVEDIHTFFRSLH